MLYVPTCVISGNIAFLLALKILHYLRLIQCQHLPLKLLHFSLWLEVSHSVKTKAFTEVLSIWLPLPSDIKITPVKDMVEYQRFSLS